MAGTELCKAYVQIIPTTQGIKGQLESILEDDVSSAGESSGESLGRSFISKLKAVIVAAGIGKFVASSLTEGAALQQSLGGIETLFKGSADRVKEYARKSFSTTGLSANEYMENVTSFSASLISSLSGDTSKAADIANMALVDMADNANKMGTSMMDIQNAYQGFAKQNYTMLDNLKLGYGGTKTEMERLLADAEKLTGIHYDISNLSDVYQAIHAIQENLNITGTTALEAEHTLSGSFASMKASFKDLLGNIALGQNIMPSLQNLFNTTFTFLTGNLLPMIGNVFRGIGTILLQNSPQLLQSGMTMLANISEGFVSGFPNFISNVLTLCEDFVNNLADYAPKIIKEGFNMLSNLVQGITNAIPELISRVPQIITTFANVINNNFPTILLKGSQLLLQFITGIIKSIPSLIAAIPKIIQAIVSSIMAYNWLSLGSNIIHSFTNGISSMKGNVLAKGKEIFQSVIQWIKNLPSELGNIARNALSRFASSITGSGGTVRSAVKAIFNAVVNTLKSLPSSVVNIGLNLVKGLWNGIKNAKSWVLNKIKGFGKSILNGIKSFFGIHSPSRLMEREVGQYIPAGMAVGIEANATSVKKAMDELNEEAMGRMNTDLVISNSNYQPREITSANEAWKDTVLQVVNNISVDGTPLKEIISEYTLKKINTQTSNSLRMRGGYSY